MYYHIIKNLSFPLSSPLSSPLLSSLLPSPPLSFPFLSFLPSFPNSAENNGALEVMKHHICSLSRFSAHRGGAEPVLFTAVPQQLAQG